MTCLTKAHTPTPWAVADDTIIYYDGDDEDVVSDFANHEIESIAEACHGHVGYRDADAANAAHIVRCVNAFDDLVTALEYCRQQANALTRQNFNTCADNTCARVTAVLARVKS